MTPVTMFYCPAPRRTEPGSRSWMAARVAWEFSLTSILQVVQVVALLCALVYWFVVNANRAVATA
jgi:hypothetical protein